MNPSSTEHFAHQRSPAGEIGRRDLLATGQLDQAQSQPPGAGLHLDALRVGRKNPARFRRTARRRSTESFAREAPELLPIQKRLGYRPGVKGAHAARDRRWHEVRTRIAGGETIEQEIVLTPEAIGRLRAASQAFVVFDLEIPAGDLQGAVVTVGGRDHPGAALAPTMPKLRESTATGRRDRRAYPQWWALEFDPALLPRDAATPLRIALRLPPGRTAWLGGDRFSGQERVYEGPSFGDWPHFVALKLEYDADYRLAVRMPLGSAATRSAVVAGDGRRRDVSAPHRVRLITLGQNEGWTEWEPPPPPPGSPAAVAWAAWSGTRGEAELAIDGRSLFRFPLGATWNYEVEGEGYRLCHAFEGIQGEKPYGVYVLSGPAATGRPATLRARFRTGMGHETLFYVVDAQRTVTGGGPCPAATSGAARVPTWHCQP